MMKNLFKQDKGQAGLTILLSVIVILFVLGLLIAIFSIMSGELYTSIGTISKSALTTVANETSFASNVTNTTTISVATATKRDFSGMTAVALFIVNGSGTQKKVPTTNYTANANGSLYMKLDANPEYVNQKVGNFSYTYYYTTNHDAQDIINDTEASLVGAIDWYDIFIVISAMVVLILLTVIIISAIRSSGMISGGTSGANTVGTA